MQTTRASIVWPGPKIDVLRLFMEPVPALWEADPIDDAFAVYLTLDDNEQETGGIADFEVLGFLGFDRWNALPELPILWQVGNWEPLPIADLLQREQALLREKHSAEPR